MLETIFLKQDDMKQKILETLKEDIYDLVFLFSPQALEMAPEVLQELLEKEKKDFYANLELQDENIDFGCFHRWSDLDVYWALLEHHKSVDSNDTIRQIIEDFEPQLVAFGNEVAYSKRYFDMMCYYLDYKNPDTEQKRILEESIKNYKIRGIDLPSETQEQLKKINQELSDLSLKFGNNALDAENDFSYHIQDETLISEMPEDEKQMPQKRAQEAGKTGYIFDASWSGYASIMTYCSDRAIRTHFYNTKNAFASSGKYDNREIILRMLQLRQKKAELMGYKNYAEYSLKTKMAPDADTVKNLIKEVFEKGKKKALSELQEIKDFYQLTDFGYQDISYFVRKYKEDKFHFDAKVLKNYFEFEKVLAGIFQVAQKLYGLEFVEVEAPQIMYASSVRLYEVKKDGQKIAYYLGDFFYRSGKRAGAWANNLSQRFITEGLHKTPLIINVCNFQKNPNGKTLLTHYDVETIFHEFGHALHEISARSSYAELSGFGVEWDFVELPSQIMENWCNEKESLDIFARHHESGESIPQNIFQTMKQIEKFGKGFFLVRQSEFGYLDMSLHSEPVPDSVEKLDQKIVDITQGKSLFPRTPEYRQYCSFHHIFDGGYAAGYYSYMWAEIIEAQVFAEFEKHGLFDQTVAQNFYNKILSKGCEQDAMILFTDFLPEGMKIDAFLERYGVSSY